MASPTEPHRASWAGFQVGVPLALSEVKNVLPYLKGEIRIRAETVVDGTVSIRIELLDPKTGKLLVWMPEEDQRIELRAGDHLTLEGAVARWTSDVRGRVGSGPHVEPED